MTDRLMTDRVLPKISLGWELEATRRAVRFVPGVVVDHDGSVAGEGLEYRVHRDLVFDPDRSLAALRHLATDPHVLVDKSCGFHVHLGLVNRTRKLPAWASWFVQLARDVEDEAFAAVPSSRRGSSYCRSWKTNPESIIAHSYSPSKHSNETRYQWVNPTEIFRPGGIRTIEVRLMGDCKRYSYLLAWISACRLMAFSAWALTSDPSRLELERNELKSVFRLIKKHFVDSSDVRQAAKLAVTLSAKALFNQPFGKPLQGIKSKEFDLDARIRISDSDRRAYQQRLSEMMERYDRHRAEQGGPVAVGSFLVGDTVQCVAVDPDQGLRIGSFYRVTDVSSSSIRVLRGESDQWNAPYRCFRLAERINTEVREGVCVAS